MSKYEQIESEIVAALVTAGLNAFVQPETESAYKRPTNDGNIYVSVASLIEYGAPGLNEGKRVFTLADKLNQPEHVFIDVYLQYIRLRGDAGVFSAWETVLNTIYGQRFADALELSLIDFSLQERGEGFYTYKGRFKAEREVVQNYSEPTTPLLVDLDFDEIILQQ